MTPTRVNVGPCRCPGAPHEPDDWVELWPEATIPIGTAVLAIVREGGTDAAIIQGRLARVYILLGIRSWSFVDEDRKPIPVAPGRVDWEATIDTLLPWTKGGMELADAADALYSDDILRPLTSRQSTRSPGGQTVGSTSPTPEPGSMPQMRSRRSSRIDTAGSPSAALVD